MTISEHHIQNSDRILGFLVSEMQYSEKDEFLQRLVSVEARGTAAPDVQLKNLVLS